MPLDLVPHAEMHPAFVLGKIPSMKPWVWEFSKKFTKNLAVAKHGMKLSDLGRSALAIVSLSDPRPAHQIPPLPVRPLSRSSDPVKPLPVMRVLRTLRKLWLRLLNTNLPSHTWRGNTSLAQFHPKSCLKNPTCFFCRDLKSLKHA